MKYPSRLYDEMFGDSSALKESEPVLWVLMCETLQDSRAKASVFASAIRTENPDLTDHSVDHLDSLWQMADLVVSAEQLNPCEALVLGLSFLFHDLGNTSLVREGGTSQKVLDVQYRAFFRQVERSSPGMSQAEIERHANFLYLRHTHAKQIEEAAVRSWSTDPSQPEFLIKDDSIRAVYGSWIGKICRSHNDSLDSVIGEFSSIGEIAPPPRFPQRYSVDLFKIACLLRICDAMHVDRRRASPFEAALRPEMPPGSQLHWQFQAKLGAPSLVSGGLVKYVSITPFRPEEADAWWTGYDYLRMVDGELRACYDAMLDLRRTQFRARGVRGIVSPREFSKTVQCAGWAPIDARVSVGDAATLARMLGGTLLYGKKPAVAIRELIQNARDAIAALRVIAGKPVGWGKVSVTATRGESGASLVIQDNGVGMTESVVARFLLTFGRSLWYDPALAEVAPKVAASESFKPVGRFGVGWFSVFLLSDYVRVVTRHYTASQSDTLVLEMRRGLHSRPLVRMASEDELLFEPGTTVVIDRITDDVWSRLISGAADFGARVLALCPAIDVDVDIYVDDGLSARLAGGDWRTISGEELVARVLGLRSLDDLRENDAEDARELARRIREIHDDRGEVVGRLALCLHGLGSPFLTTNVPNVVVDGGLSSGDLGMYVAGLCFGSSSVVSRSEAAPSVATSSFLKWLEEQVGFEPLRSWSAEVFSVLCHALGRADDVQAAVCQTSDGPKTATQLREWVASRSAIGLLLDIHPPRDLAVGLVCCPQFVMTDSWLFGALSLARPVPGMTSDYCSILVRKIFARALCAIMRAWGGVIDEVDELTVLEYTLKALNRSAMRVSRSDTQHVQQVWVLRRDQVLAILEGLPRRSG